VNGDNNILGCLFTRGLALLRDAKQTAATLHVRFHMKVTMHFAHRGTHTHSVERVTIKGNTVTDTSKGVGNGFGIEIRASVDSGVVSGNTLTGASLLRV
jgi:hypothetical protein